MGVVSPCPPERSEWTGLHSIRRKSCLIFVQPCMKEFIGMVCYIDTTAMQNAQSLTRAPLNSIATDEEVTTWDYQ